MRRLKNILVTGGSGFIGSNFINYLFGLSESELKDFTDSEFTGKVINVDSLTYAGNNENLAKVDRLFGSCVPDEKRRYFFEKADICNHSQIERIFRQYDIDTVVHFAAETHVDRSILSPEAFINTNVKGTFTLLEASRSYWNVSLLNPRSDVHFHHVSTDEVYGSAGTAGSFTENSPYAPRSPYSASKAASDHLVMAYHHTYGLPVTVSNCTNNYGPHQFPEKFLPLMILNIRDKKNLPVYGAGKNIRDWIYVEDHNRAVWKILRHGLSGEKYNIAGENEWHNIDLLEKVIEITSAKTDRSACEIKKNITFVKDREGHDFRYSIDCTKIKKELGWEQKMPFNEGLEFTVNWYLEHSGACS